MSVVIRPLAATDRAAWGALWREYLAFYETALPGDIYDLTFKRLLSPDHPDQNGFLAEMAGVPVGLVHFIYHAHNWRAGKGCYLQDLYTAPTARGRGVGRALVEAVYARADADEYPSVYWLTQEHNHTARQLYDRVATLTPFVKYAR